MTSMLLKNTPQIQEEQDLIQKKLDIIDALLKDVNEKDFIIYLRIIRNELSNVYDGQQIRNIVDLLRKYEQKFVINEDYMNIKELINSIESLIGVNSKEKFKKQDKEIIRDIPNNDGFIEPPKIVATKINLINFIGNSKNKKK